MQSFEIVSGRVLSTSTHHLVIEFDSASTPAPGSVLTSSSGALVEVLEKTSPSEVRGALRRGPIPTPSSLLTRAEGPLTLPPIDTLWGQRVTLSEILEGGGEARTDLARIEAGPHQKPQVCSQWPLGFAGVDLLAPLIEGSSLAITSVRERPEPLLGVHLQWAAAQAQASVLWISSSETLPGPALDARTIHLLCSQSAGARALLLRAAVTLACAATAAGHRLLVFLDEPLEAAIAWREVDGVGFSAGQMAVRHYEDAVASLLGPTRALVAHLPMDPIRLGALAAGNYDPRGLNASVAAFDGPAMMPRETTSRWIQYLPETQRLVSQRAREFLTDHSLADHAAIFGEDELEPDQLSRLEAQRTFESWLSGPPETTSTLEETLTSAAQTP